MVVNWQSEQVYMRNLVVRFSIQMHMCSCHVLLLCEATYILHFCVLLMILYDTFYLRAHTLLQSQVDCLPVHYCNAGVLHQVFTPEFWHKQQLLTQTLRSEMLYECDVIAPL
jgi:hypothetical protein